MIEYIPVTDNHIRVLAENARQLDIDEVSALSPSSMLDVINSSVQHSTLSATCFVDGELNAILGVCPASKSIINTVGIPWMIGTDLVTKNKRVFCSEYGRIIKQMLGEYSLLENVVDTRNKPAITFLKRAGFTIEEPKPIGINGALFHRFYKRA